MGNHRLIAVSFMVFICATWLTLLSSCDGQVQAAKAPQPRAFEYATFHPYGYTVMLPDSEIIRADNLEELAVKVGVPEDAVGQLILLILNQLGADGWQVVAHVKNHNFEARFGTDFRDATYTLMREK